MVSLGLLADSYLIGRRKGSNTSQVGTYLVHLNGQKIPVPAHLFSNVLLILINNHHPFWVIVLTKLSVRAIQLLIFRLSVC